MTVLQHKVGVSSSLVCLLQTPEWNPFGQIAQFGFLSKESYEKIKAEVGDSSNNYRIDIGLQGNNSNQLAFKHAVEARPNDIIILLGRTQGQNGTYLMPLVCTFVPHLLNEYEMSFYSGGLSNEVNDREISEKFYHSAKMLTQVMPTAMDLDVNFTAANFQTKYVDMVNRARYPQQQPVPRGHPMPGSSQNSYPQATVPNVQVQNSFQRPPVQPQNRDFLLSHQSNIYNPLPHMLVPQRPSLANIRIPQASNVRMRQPQAQTMNQGHLPRGRTLAAHSLQLHSIHNLSNQQTAGQMLDHHQLLSHPMPDQPIRPHPASTGMNVSQLVQQLPQYVVTSTSVPTNYAQAEHSSRDSQLPQSQIRHNQPQRRPSPMASQAAADFVAHARWQGRQSITNASRTLEFSQQTQVPHTQRFLTPPPLRRAPLVSQPSRSTTPAIVSLNVLYQNESFQLTLNTLPTCDLNTWDRDPCRAYIIDDDKLDEKAKRSMRGDATCHGSINEASTLRIIRESVEKAKYPRMWVFQGTTRGLNLRISKTGNQTYHVDGFTLLQRVVHDIRLEGNRQEELTQRLMSTRQSEASRQSVPDQVQDSLDDAPVSPPAMSEQDAALTLGSIVPATPYIEHRDPEEMPPPAAPRPSTPLGTPSIPSGPVSPPGMSRQDAAQTLRSIEPATPYAEHRDPMEMPVPPITEPRPQSASTVVRQPPMPIDSAAPRANTPNINLADKDALVFANEMDKVFIKLPRVAPYSVLKDLWLTACRVKKDALIAFIKTWDDKQIQEIAALLDNLDKHPNPGPEQHDKAKVFVEFLQKIVNPPVPQVDLKRPGAQVKH